MSNSLYNFAKSFHKKEVSTYRVPSTTKRQAAGLSPGRAADRTAVARSTGRGREPPVVLIASTSAANPMCDLEKATLQIPFGLLYIAEDCLALWVQPQSLSESSD